VLRKWLAILFLSLFSFFRLFPKSPVPFDAHIYKAEVDRLASYNRDIFHLPDRYNVLGKIGSYQNIVVTSAAACSKSR